MTDFQPFPKIARLNRGCVVTEKLDGTNAAIVIVEKFWGQEIEAHAAGEPLIAAIWGTDVGEDGLPLMEYHVYAQSRNKFITPGKSTDNYGFAGWVKRNAEELVKALGPGTHFGEWWGGGIQRGYGLKGDDKRFSLFNTHRWDYNDERFEAIPELNTVPVLYVGPFDTLYINDLVEQLPVGGSVASPGYLKPEGVCIYNAAAKTYFKVTVEGDEKPKGQV